MAQLEADWTVNHVVGRSSPSWVKFTTSIQQASNPKIAGSFGSRPKLGGPRVPQYVIGTCGNNHLCPSRIRQVLRLSGVVSLDVLRFAFLWTTPTVPEVVGTENWVTSNLPFLLDPSSIAKIQS